MNISRKDLPKSQTELKISLNAEDIKPHLIHAAQHISQTLNIPGFRPGKAPYDLVKRQVGDEEIFKHALDEMVNRVLIDAMKSEDVYPYGDPELKMDKIVPMQEVEFTVKMSVYPKIKLGAWPTGKIKLAEVTASKEEIKKAIDDLSKMLVREELVDRPAALNDTAVIDFDVLVNGVPIEGGSAKDFNMIVGEGRMIPGFEDQVVGMKAGEVKDFKLNFPPDYNAELGGKEAEFKVAVKQVLSRTIPEVDDEMAKRLGVKDRADLEAKMEENVKSEKRDREMQKTEIEAVKKVVAAAEIGELPEKMVKDEVHRIIHEFEHDLMQQGLNLEMYMKQVKKNKEEIEKEFEPKAIDRIKTSLVLDELAEQEKVQADESHIEREWAQQKEHYKNNPDVLAEVSRMDYRRHLESRLRKIKTIDLITDKLVEK